MIMPRIGVVMATYNGEKYVAKQLESIVEQSLKPNIIVVSDGGSTDNTVKICRDYLSNTDIDYTILESTSHLSVTKNFERAYTFCKSAKYIFFADQDDIWLPNKISDLVQVMEDNGAMLGFSNASIVDEDMNYLGKDLWSSIGFKPKDVINIYQPNDTEMFLRLIKGNYVTGMCMCVHKSAHKYIVPMSYNTLHDYWIALICANVGVTVAYNKALVKYRQHRDNVVGTKRSIKKALANAYDYKSRLDRRVRLVDDLEYRLRGFMKTANTKLIKEYKDYLILRQGIIDGSTKAYTPLTCFEQYKRFELDPMSIVAKDLIVRFGV